VRLQRGVPRKPLAASAASVSRTSPSPCPAGTTQPGVETVLGDHRQGDAGRLGGVDEAVGGGQADVDRLLYD
jgi:hypothetical protein